MTHLMSHLGVKKAVGEINDEVYKQNGNAYNQKDTGDDGIVLRLRLLSGNFCCLFAAMTPG